MNKPSLKEPLSEGKERSSRKPKFLALTVISASTYLALGLMLQNVAFGNIQVRMADALYPVIAALGSSWLVGTFLGHFIFNLYGLGIGIALGFGDLVSPFIFLAPKILIWKFGSSTWQRLTLTTSMHVMVVAFWVSWLLYTMFGIPYWLSVVTVGAGEFIAEVLLGVPLTLAIKRRTLHG